MSMNPRFEDTLQCFFFSTSKLSEKEWERLCESINGIINTISKDYIWHRDEFRVYLPLTKVTNDVPCHLLSTTCIGDNIEDEWFIIHLLLEITKLYNHLIVQVEDNDGDFLLIEAADHLPVWANPETTENRVFIFNQHLHLIPATVSPTDKYLELVDAIKLVTQNPDVTKASYEIEQAIIKRIGNYPEKIIKCAHKAILKLPVEIATVLTLKPSLISPIVNTYCNIDAIDAKYCKNIKFDDCMNVSIKFTKYLYAMLMQSELPTYMKCNSSMKEKNTQLGVKVTCAYEIIMSKLSKDVYDTPDYIKFVNSLTNNGYFKGNLKGSLEYSQLLEKAKVYFLNMECSMSLSTCNTIKEIKLSREFDSNAVLLRQKTDTVLLEDNDDWLNVNPDQLNDFLNTHYGKKIKLKNTDPITPHILTSELNDFLAETSNYEGIENTKDCIDFNSEDFVNSLKNMLNMVANQSDMSGDNSSDDDASVKLGCEAQDVELASELDSIVKYEGAESVYNNLSQSLREEGATGPVSIMLRQMGVQKSDLLDSDDDE